MDQSRCDEFGDVRGVVECELGVAPRRAMMTVERLDLQCSAWVARSKLENGSDGRHRS